MTIKLFPNEKLKNNCDYIIRGLVIEHFLSNWCKILEF